MPKKNFDPLGEIENEAKQLIKKSINEIYPEILGQIDIQINRPPKREFGDLSSTVSFQIAKKLTSSKKEMRKLSIEIAKKIIEKISITGTIFKKVEAKDGYINFFLRNELLARKVIKSILELGDTYGSTDIGEGKVVVVEHTSANPIHPLHIGTARNSVLGDSLARIYEFLGYKVSRRFYVDDMGKQVAYLVYGLSKLNDMDAYGKIDHWLGIVYASVNVVIQIKEISRKIKEMKELLIKGLYDLLERLRSHVDNDEIKKVYYKAKILLEKLEITITADLNTIVKEYERLLDEINGVVDNSLIKDGFDLLKDLKKLTDYISDWTEAEKEIRKKWNDIYSKVFEKTLEENIDEEVSKLIHKYEFGEKETVKMFKEACNKALHGFEETLKKFDINFDAYDWESELVWSGKVKEILKKLEENNWIIKESDTKASFLNLRKALLELEDVRRIFGLSLNKVERAIKEGKEDILLPPNLALTRSDGTTLYTTRDIAYSIYKFEKTGAEKVLNIIGVDQTLAQKQIKAALILAGYKNYAENLIHVAYELVSLPGAKFSSRRGRFITFDEVFLETKKRVFEIITSRDKTLDEREAEVIAEKVAVGAIKYFLLSVSPTKKLVFNWDRVLDFEQNSGPFLQYAYTRAFNILKKVGFETPKDINFEVLREEAEIDLIWLLSEFPRKVKEAANMFKPDILAEYANKLAQTFNSFYQRHRVLQAENEEVKNARLALVAAYMITMGNILKLLGIPTLEKM